MKVRRLQRRLWAAAKQSEGRRFYALYDRTVAVTAASVQDRDAVWPLLWNLARACTRIRLARADAGYAGKLTAWAAASLSFTVEIVRKRDAHALRCSHAAGSSSGHSPGSPAAAAPAKTQDS